VLGFRELEKKSGGTLGSPSRRFSKLICAKLRFGIDCGRVYSNA
jgi:hypothetical protein